MICMFHTWLSPAQCVDDWQGRWLCFPQSYPFPFNRTFNDSKPQWINADTDPCMVLDLSSSTQQCWGPVSACRAAPITLLSLLSRTHSLSTCHDWPHVYTEGGKESKDLRKVQEVGYYHLPLHVQLLVQYWCDGLFKDVVLVLLYLMLPSTTEDNIHNLSRHLKNEWEIRRFYLSYPSIRTMYQKIGVVQATWRVD